MTAIGKRLQNAKNQAVSYRNYRRVRDRALTRLANAYPETYKELLEQEKAVDEQLYKKWIDLDGNTSADMGTSTRPDTSGVEAGSYHKEDEGER
jgi:hypothetical protein